MFRPSKTCEIRCLKAALLAECASRAWEQAGKEEGLQKGAQDKAATPIIDRTPCKCLESIYYSPIFTLVFWQSDICLQCAFYFCQLFVVWLSRYRSWRAASSRWKSRTCPRRCLRQLSDREKYDIHTTLAVCQLQFALGRVCCAELSQNFLLETVTVDLPEKFQGQALGQFLSSFERLKKTEKKRSSQSDAREKIVATQFLHQKAQPVLYALSLHC